jgi:alpha/beta superfamily hydrolase
MDEERITFENSRGDALSGVLHHPRAAKPKGGAVLCHGMESDKNSEKLIYLGRRLAEANVLTLRFDFAYVGESSGQFEDITYSGEVMDLKAAFSLMQDRCAGSTGIFGSSMGGTIGLLFAARQSRVAALVTLAAPVHPENFPTRVLDAAQLQQWRDTGFIFYNGRRLNVSMLEDLQSLDVPQAARAVQCPVLILHGDADEVVPVNEAYELHECLSGAKRLSILKGSDHRVSDPALMQRALEESLDWLIDHVG